MLEVKFYNEIEDRLITFAVIAAKSNNLWVFCKHKERDTYEVPGGHRELDEPILDTAKRELYEETGATCFDIKPICVYSVKDNKEKKENEAETYGMLYYAEISRFDELPDYEMEKIELFDDLPANLTYPLIQPILFDRVKQYIEEIERDTDVHQHLRPLFGHAGLV